MSGKQQEKSDVRADRQQAIIAQTSLLCTEKVEQYSTGLNNMARFAPQAHVVHKRTA